jgi:hypothetical protein
MVARRVVAGLLADLMSVAYGTCHLRADRGNGYSENDAPLNGSRQPNRAASNDGLLPDAA